MHDATLQPAVACLSLVVYAVRVSDRQAADDSACPGLAVNDEQCEGRRPQRQRARRRGLFMECARVSMGAQSVEG